jgi:hypothetical protein
MQNITAQRRASDGMRLKANLLILWNLIALLPATFYFISWLILSIRALFATLGMFLFIGSVFLIVSSILSSIILKLRILREVGDSGLFAVKATYSGATRVNIVSYVILYPILFGLTIHQLPIGTIFLFVALIMAIPIRTRIGSLKKEYESSKRKYGLGRHSCPRCGVSLAYSRRYRRWRCYPCRKWY